MTKHFFFVALSYVGMLVSTSFGQASKNVELVGRLPYDRFIQDVWGYVDGAGTEYALVGTREGLSIVSLANPSEPTEIFFVEGAHSNWRDIKTFRNYAYVANETADGVAIIDLSDLPQTIRKKDTVIAGVETMHNLWIEEAEGTLYMVGLDETIFNGGLLICDLNTDPWKPEFMGIYDGNYVHDVYVRGDRAYAAEITARQMAIIDVSNKASTFVLGTIDYKNSFTHNTWLNDEGTVCFTTDETANVYIRSWDVTNPENIVALDSIRSSLSQGEAIPHNVHVLNDFLITSYYKDGVHIVDAHRADILVEIGYYDTSPESGLGSDGCWGAYPFLPSGLILASDIGEGLFVLQPTYKLAAYVEGTVVDAGNGSSIEGARLEILGDGTQAVTEADGIYGLGTVTEGMFQMVTIKFGYLPDTSVVNLVNGETYFQDINLIPAPNQVFRLQLLDAETQLPISDGVVSAIPLHEEIEFSYRTDENGEVLAPQMIQGVYEIFAAKWGYLNQVRTISIAGNNETFVFLLNKGYQDDFALDLGWETSGNASAGYWELGIPRGTHFFNIPVNPPTDVEGDIGAKAYLTGNQGLTYFDDDIDDGFVMLSSPVFDLTDYIDPAINFRWWLVNFKSNPPGERGNGFLSAQLSNGDTTVDIALYENSFNGDKWRFTSVQVADFIEATDQMQIHFVAADPEPGNIVEAGIDAFSVSGETTTDIKGGESSFMHIFPNPIEDDLQLSYELGSFFSAELQIVDINGRVLQRRQLKQSTAKLKLSFPYASGIYFIQIKHGDHLLEVKKMIKK